MLCAFAAVVLLAWVPLPRPAPTAGSISRAASCRQPLRMVHVAGSHDTVSNTGQLHRDKQSSAPLRVMVAGGGIGGLCAALVLKNQGYQVRMILSLPPHLRCQLCQQLMSGL